MLLTMANHVFFGVQIWLRKRRLSQISDFSFTVSYNSRNQQATIVGDQTLPKERANMAKNQIDLNRTGQNNANQETNQDSTLHNRASQNGTNQNGGNQNRANKASNNRYPSQPDPSLFDNLSTAMFLFPVIFLAPAVGGLTNIATGRFILGVKATIQMTVLLVVPLSIYARKPQLRTTLVRHFKEMLNCNC